MRHLGIAFAIAEDVDSRIYGLAHRLLIGFVLAGYVVACAVVGTGAHILQSGGEVHPTLHGNHLKWCQSLVVIHGKHAIEVGVLLVAEKSVGCVGPECRDFAIYGFLYGGNYHGLLFLAQQAAVAGVRIERKHCYARAHHAKIALERIVKLYYLLKHQFLGDSAADVGHGHMGGDQCHAHIFAEKYHQRLVAVAYAGFEILGMSRKCKLVALYALFIYWCRYEHIYIALLEVAHSVLQCIEGCLAGIFARHAEVHFHLFARHFHQIIHSVLYVGSALYHVHRHRLQFKCLAMIACRLGRPIYHRRKQLGDLRALKCLQYHFIAYAVGVSLCYTNAYNLIVCH